MIQLAADFLVKEFNTWLAQRGGDSVGNALLSRIVTDAGKWAIPDDRIGVALVNVEEERSVRTQAPQPAYLEGRQVLREPEIKLNLTLLFAAHFKDYDHGLRQLSYVLTYFQAHSVFTRVRYPALDARIEKLAVDLMTLGYEQLNQLWAFVGAKQLPSAVYRVRMIALQDEEPTGVQPPITVIGTTIDLLVSGSA